MPIGKKFSPANEQHIKENAPASKGVYELKSFGEVVYIGSSSDLRERLLTHLQSRNPNGYRYETLGILKSPTSAERDHYDRHIDKHGEEPTWNDRRP